MNKSPKQVLILFVIQSLCATELTTDYAFLLDGNLINPRIQSENHDSDIIPQKNNFRRRYKLPVENSREDFFKVHEVSDESDDVADTNQVTHGSSTLKIDGIIEKLAKKESEYKLASIIRELQKKLTTVSTTTTKKTQKTTTKSSKKTVKTTKGPKTKFKWNKPKKLPLVTKKRSTTMATKKFFFKDKEVVPSSDPSRRSCGRMSPNQEKLLGNENDVSNMIFFSPQKAKPIAKPKPKPKPKPKTKRRLMKWGNKKNNKGGKQNNKKRTTKKKLVKNTKTTERQETTTTEVTTRARTPEWLSFFLRAQKQGRIIDPKKPVFENDTHVIMLKNKRIDKLDESEMEYPFIVTLHGDKNIERVCIGSLIAPTWVVTAAHCISPPNVVTRVRYGDMSLPLHQSKFSPIVLTVVNPSFDESMLINDVCLLKVKQIPIDEKVGKLSSIEYKSLMGQPIIYAGFGFTATNRKALEDFRKPIQIVEAEVVSCANENQLAPTFCISMNHWKKHEMTLLGDAGSPAIHSGMIAGICTGEVYAPIAVYTPVSPYLDWIRYTVLLNEM